MWTIHLDFPASKQHEHGAIVIGMIESKAERTAEELHHRLRGLGSDAEPCQTQYSHAATPQLRIPSEEPSGAVCPAHKEGTTLISLKNQGDPLREPKGAERCNKVRGAIEERSL